jgi:hypothetical protein
MDDLLILEYCEIIDVRMCGDLIFKIVDDYFMYMLSYDNFGGN